MKKLILSLMVLFVFAGLFARPIGMEEARAVAEMKIQIEQKNDFTIKDVFVMEDEQKILAFVFHLEPQGFIAISTDSDITPVISYSFKFPFVEQDIDLNIGYQMLKTDMGFRQQAIPHFSSEKLAQNNQSWQNYLTQNHSAFNFRDEIYPPEGYSNTNGWVEVLYNQSAPYFSFCPIDPGTGSRCVTGCVATAMAMLMQYHHQFGNPTFTDADDYISTETYPYIYIDNDHDTYDFPSFPELNNYFPSLIENLESWTPLTNENLAALHFAAGIAVEMEYASEGSGASSGDVAPALLNKFGFSEATYVTNANTTFYNNLAQNMMDAKPAYLGIIQSGAPYGHAILADGYNVDEDTYHLNMGWGGSSNGWYSLPQGMPGFNIITRAVIDIEDDSEPFTVIGQALVDQGVEPTDVYVTLDGPRLYEGYITDDSGYFTYDYVVAGTYDVTAIIELEGGGYHYVHEVMELDEDNNNAILFLDIYEELTASVSASTSPEGAGVQIYDGDQVVTSGLADANGDVSMIGILPGEYFAVASLNGTHFGTQDVVISAANQHIDFQIYAYNSADNINFAGTSTGETYSLFDEMSCGIKLAGEDIAEHGGDAIATVNFIAPYNPDVGQIYAQLWNGNILISEHEITNFAAGEWVEVSFQHFGVIDPDNEYYVGYKIVTPAGTTPPAAYHDAGPLVAGKGAFIKFSGWIPIPAGNDFNFCINADVISENVSANNAEVPAASSLLLNNYPNPFNPVTTITYYVNEQSDVSIEVFNIKGQKVRTLVNTQKPQGTHNAVWNGKDDNDQDVSSGMYLYRMKTGDRYTSTKKMILLK